VYKTLKDAVRHDKARTNLLPISDLGLLEMTRQRQQESIHSQAHMDCPYCRGRGNVKSALSMSVDIQRHLAEVMRKLRSAKIEVQKIRVGVHPLILDRLRSADEELLINLESRYGVNMVFQADAGLHVEEFLISNPTSGEVLYTNVEGMRASGMPAPGQGRHDGEPHHA
ncbi:MAG: ribonuclease E/G, partial [Kiritimatiellia bacterium]